MSYQFAVVSTASSGDNTLVAAQGAGLRVRVLGLVLVAAGAVTVRLESGAGGTAMTGVMSLITGTPLVIPLAEFGWTETAENALLNLELGGAVQVSGTLVYSVVS